MGDNLDFIAKNTPVLPISLWMGDNLDFIAKNTPALPISGSMSDNLLKKSEDMAWWKGTKAWKMVLSVFATGTMSAW